MQGKKPVGHKRSPYVCKKSVAQLWVSWKYQIGICHCLMTTASSLLQ